MEIEMLVGLNVIDDDAYQLYRDEITPILKTFGGGFGYDFKNETRSPLSAHLLMPLSTLLIASSIPVGA